jgi:hypothetical protein
MIWPSSCHGWVRAGVRIEYFERRMDFTVRAPMEKDYTLIECYFCGHCATDKARREHAREGTTQCPKCSAVIKDKWNK